MPRNDRLAVLMMAGLVMVAACTAPAPTTTSRPSEAAPGSAAPNTTDTGVPLEGIHAADGLGDSYYPALGNEGYDIQSVQLELRVDPEAPSLQGTADYLVTALETLDSFTFDFDTLEVEEVAVNGAEAPHSHSGGELRIDPEPVIEAGEEFEVTIMYGGAPVPFESMAAPFRTGLVQGLDSLFAFSEPDGTSSWMPINDHPLDKATYRIAATVRNPLVVAASGTLIETELVDEDTTRYVWESNDPIAPYLVAFAVGDFVRADEVGPSEIPIRNYFDDDIEPDLLVPFAAQSEMMAFLIDTFGPYPFDQYGSLVVDTVDLGAALETQTLSTYGRQSLALGEDVVVHELAHQWFGNSVSVGDWSDIWLNEGFATYTQWLWLEHKGDADRMNTDIEFAYDVMSGAFYLAEAGGADAARQIAQESFPPPGRPAPDDLFNASIYFRGGLLLHALRLEVGDDDFFNILRTYADRHAYGNATTEDFVDVVEGVTGSDFSLFFDAWLFEPEIPPIPELGLEPPR